MKSYVVFGLGRFGSTVAITLSELGYDVLAVDSNFDRVQSVADKVTTAIQVDMMDENATENLGLKNFDGAVVAIGENFEAAIMSSIVAQEAGIPLIIAKANTVRQGKILQKIGVNEVVYPEKDMGSRVAYNLTSKNLLDYIQISQELSIAEIRTLPSWWDKTIENLEIRNKFNITILGIERNGKVEVNPAPDTVLRDDDILIIVGKDEHIKMVEKKS
ncbi:trk system potassium uptake protein TrkA [Peptoniphilus asaccharolyticus DSM 20463]|uniref:Trk system potassium uptake protein TrkA n=1 Tax=Peptoniphilus asaccharolyticus DSM 20463 TaxID=573058 RepID=A0A1W1UPR0_PEPAS|nr:TrkA family potassium uptake protein [Peptoniphilus asaccharolyticus]MBL7575002.1 TrkA family potassium uptake protein [Peptoniphilus asaccharolyticus]SMB83077.1 trk system potassium uptake protein TrkA [Peptoniphilus asaccharolyticus DSM 20463]